MLCFCNFPKRLLDVFLFPAPTPLVAELRSSKSDMVNPFAPANHIENLVDPCCAFLLQPKGATPAKAFQAFGGMWSSMPCQDERVIDYWILILPLTLTLSLSLFLSVPSTQHL